MIIVAKLLLLSLMLSLGKSDGACDTAGPTNRSARLLTALYGYAGCIGAPNPADLSDLRERNCTVVTLPNGSEITNVPPSQAVSLLCRTTIQHADGLVVTLSGSVIEDTLDANDFSVTLSDGSIVVPLCARTGPANEGNELHTVLLLGTFGDGRAGAIHPIAVEVTGELCVVSDGPNGTSVDARGLRLENTPGMVYESGGLEIAYARLRQFSADGEGFSRAPATVYPNHCDAIYGDGSTSHNIQIWLSGGGTIDGVQSVLPHNTGIFEVLLSDGTVLGAPHVLGLADLGIAVEPSVDTNAIRSSYAGDGDNYFDICLAVDAKTAGSIAEVRMPCVPMSPGALVPPKGFPACSPNSFTLNAIIPGEDDTGTSGGMMAMSAFVPALITSIACFMATN